MSDWIFLNKHRVRLDWLRGVDPCFATTDADGWNGLFRFYDSNMKLLRCLASDGSGQDDTRFKWQHVSVSLEGEPRRVPPWATMCWIKELFWEPEDWVCQFHPAKSEYVNHHPGCLHLWRPLLERLPTPNAIMVGPKL